MKSLFLMAVMILGSVPASAECGGRMPCQPMPRPATTTINIISLHSGGGCQSGMCGDGGYRYAMPYPSGGCMAGMCGGMGMGMNLGGGMGGLCAGMGMNYGYGYGGNGMNCGRSGGCRRRSGNRRPYGFNIAAGWGGPYGGGYVSVGGFSH